MANGKAVKAQEKFLPEVGSSSVPAFMQGGKTTRMGNIDKSDMLVPRLKLLSGISPEVETFEKAKAGKFWHNMADEVVEDALGGVQFVPIIMRKSFVLWAPRGDDRGILARSRDAIHWDPPEGEFRVKPKKAGGKEVTWKLAPTVAASGLAEFGSSIPDDPKSAPAASLTYEILAWLVEHPELSPVVILNTRSAVKKARQLISKIEGRPANHYGQLIRMSSVKETSPEGDFWNYAYQSDGYVTDEGLYHRLEAMYQEFQNINWAPSDMTEEQPEGGDGAPQGNVGGKSGKF